MVRLSEQLWRYEVFVDNRVVKAVTPITKPFDARVPEKPAIIPIVRRVSELRERRRKALLRGRSVGLVPTMGALHEGHLTLIRKAATQNHEVYVSIYVNPTQFGVNEDLTSYPRTFTADMEELQKLSFELQQNERLGQIDTVFNPTTEVMYPTSPPTSAPDGAGSFVNITPLGTLLEGAARPVFFRGVATVCMKLFNIVQPDNVYFGQKDIQQSMLIHRMVRDFHVNTKVHIVPTMREHDGMAMSSRNIYLGKRRRDVATVLIKALRAAEGAYLAGKLRSRELLDAALEVASSVQESQRRLAPSQRARFEVDYLSLVDPYTLSDLAVVDPEKGAVICGALRMLPLEEPQSGENAGLGGGKSTVRLIDNILLERAKMLEIMHAI